ncbi:Gastric triacylglycerol lipase [Chionoecetes opilio]|uniref:Gastric triacylglycerol lipase n=1 Tax=Chionoecetes opilio TaxID=41210 RepID=A0A8J4YDG3_CHIOP|nr:Gastric triacylglycerol lipase [Chionoecetes opilio]
MMGGQAGSVLFLFLLTSGLTDGDINPDIYLDVPGLITKYGFPVETHIVQTEDGYLLTLHRIPHGRAGGTGQDQNQVVTRDPVLMQHGLLSSSSCWIMGAPEKAPAYMMADAGYDVWLGNARGNTYARNHTTLNPDGKDGKFWDFSWDEMGRFDVPAMIDYILAQTGHTSLYYVGHSMGTTMFFTAMAVRPEYNSKVKAMFGLGPVATVKNIRSPIRYLAPLASEMEELLFLLGRYEFLPHSKEFTAWVEKACAAQKYVELMCMNSLFLLTGFDQAEFNMTWLPVILANNPAGTSVRTIAHYAQGVESGKFQHFDFGARENMRRYHQRVPPLYNLKNVVAPVGLLWGVNDYLADPKDVARLAAGLPHVVHDVRMPRPAFNHIDFIWGIDADKLVVPFLICWQRRKDMPDRCNSCPACTPRDEQWLQYDRGQALTVSGKGYEPWTSWL